MQISLAMLPNCKSEDDKRDPETAGKKRSSGYDNSQASNESVLILLQKRVLSRLYK